MKLKNTLATALMALAAPALMAQERLLGGDISLLPSYEAEGTVFRNAEGEAVEPLGFFKEQGWNAIRVRLFVEPEKAPADHKGEGVCQDLDYVLRFGQRIKEAGYRFMLDFHYSDTWADPGKQFMPDRWKETAREALPDSLYAYTRQCLETLCRAGAVPDLPDVASHRRCAGRHAGRTGRRISRQGGHDCGNCRLLFARK